MGARGIVNRPESELARPRSRKGGDQQPVTKGERRQVAWPEAPEHWGDLARDLYEGTRVSGQADFYQQSDIAYLTFVCEEVNNYMAPKTFVDDNGEEKTYLPKRSGQMLQAITSSMQSLLLTEGDRRRVRIELADVPVERPKLASVARLAYADVANPVAGMEG